jgi:Ca-activated chloride channel family protein
MGVKIYTIGAGTQGLAPMPVEMFGQRAYQNVPVEIDEVSLKKIASMTNAKYFRATDTDSLRQIYKEIDGLEKTKIDKRGYRQYQELFWIFVVIALGFVALDLILLNTLFFKIP